MAVGDAAAGWIAYVILLIQGLVYVAHILMFVIKVLEGLVRWIGHVPFDDSPSRPSLLHEH